ncbi:MAG: sugar ABC transporter permease [Anaerolineales bacterium]|nr:sugar ABC transporter permease [Anaerolineales bacterium]
MERGRARKVIPKALTKHAAGGPLDSTITITYLIYLIYKWAFRDTTIQMGQASALAVVHSNRVQFD